MNCLRLPLLGSKTVIQATRIPSFTCVLRCHTSSPKGKGRNLISSNSLDRAQLTAYWLENQNVHRLLNPGQLPTHAVPKRLSLIFLLTVFSQRDPIPIVNSIIDTVCIVGGRWVAHYYSPSPKNSKEIDCFQNRLLYLC